MKSEIHIWKGTPYLHQEWKVNNLGMEKDIPLPGNEKILTKMISRLKCDVLFLNDDFGVKVKYTMAEKARKSEKE